MDFRDSVVAKRISLFLIVSILLEITAPAFAKPFWEVKPNYPQARSRVRERRKQQAIDPHLQPIVAKAVPQLRNLPPGVDHQLLPTAQAQPQGEDSPSESESPPVPETLGPVAPVQPSAVDEVEHSEDSEPSEDPGHLSHRPELAVLLADPRQSHPHHEVARQAYEFGPYFKPQMVHAAYEVFVNDYVTHLHQRYDNLANEETLLWLFKSPNAANNGIHLPAGDCAAALEWKYRAQGSSPADFEAKYQLQVKVWSASSRHGKVVFQRKEATKLCFLEPACAIAARDVGVWEIHMLRNGSEVTMKALDVHESPLAEQPGLTRRFDQHFEPLDEGAAYTSDEYLNYQKSYVPTAPDAHGRQDMTVQFNFRSPKSGQNRTRWGSAFSLTQRYQSNGTTSRLEKRVYDSLYRRGHTYQATTSEGRVAQLSLAGGPGLGSYGNWKLIERIDHHSLPAQTVPVRKILAMAQLPAGDLRQNTGSVAYQIKVATFPEDWNPGDIAWNLKLRNGENNQVLANYEGLFLEEAGEQIRTTVQPWDGLDEETGQKPPAGTMILPELDIHLFSQDTPVIHQLQQSAAFRSGQRAFTVSAAASNAEWYHMAGEVDRGCPGRRGKYITAEPQMRRPRCQTDRAAKDHRAASPQPRSGGEGRLA